VQDQSGNVTEWTLEPAFAVGKFGTVVSVEDEPDKKTSLPVTYELYPNYPNPFNAGTVITFDLPRAERVAVKIYDVLGREVHTLLDGVIEAGRHKITWNGTNKKGEALPTGIYIYQMKAGSFTSTRKLLLLR